VSRRWAGMMAISSQKCCRFALDACGSCESRVHRRLFMKLFNEPATTVRRMPEESGGEVAPLRKEVGGVLLVLVRSRLDL
jgi:hypothetical protein